MKSERPMPADRKRPAPGDEAAPGSGRKIGKRCENCAGTGKVIRGIGGA